MSCSQPPRGALSIISRPDSCPLHWRGILPRAIVLEDRQLCPHRLLHVHCQSGIGNVIQVKAQAKLEIDFDSAATALEDAPAIMTARCQNQRQLNALAEPPIAKASRPPVQERPSRSIVTKEAPSNQLDPLEVRGSTSNRLHKIVHSAQASAACQVRAVEAQQSSSGFMWTLAGCATADRRRAHRYGPWTIKTLHWLWVARWPNTRSKSHPVASCGMARRSRRRGSHEGPAIGVGPGVSA